MPLGYSVSPVVKKLNHRGHGERHREILSPVHPHQEDVFLDKRVSHVLKSPLLHACRPKYCGEQVHKNKKQC